MPGHLSWEEITGTTFNDMIHLFASSGTSEAAPPLFQVGAFIHVSGLAATCIHAEKVCHTPSHVSGSDFLSCFFFCFFFVYQHFCLPKTALSLRSVAYSECNLIAGATDHCVVKWVVTFLAISFFISHSLFRGRVPSRTACCESLCSGWSAIKT